MNTAVTSKEAILKTCRQLVSEKGLSSLNMRAVAQACGVALGSIYYYFPSKNDLLIETIASVWDDIFSWKENHESALSFTEYIEECFSHIQRGTQKYPNFFTIHSISFSTKGQSKGKQTMERYLVQIKEKMLCSLKSDACVRANTFTSRFSELAFVDFVLSNMINLLIQKENDCMLLLEIIRRIIYEVK